jgi:ABC-type glycerol-3-phosphate transport system substrate-binding protein
VGWVIPAGSQNQEAGYKFIEWLTSKEGAKMWALNGGIPSNVEALSDPEGRPGATVRAAGRGHALPQPGPPLTVTSDLVTALNEAVVAAVTGTKEPQAALDDAAAKITDMLTQAGYLL